METLKDLVADTRAYEGTAIDFPSRAAPYTYSDFAGSVWKSGNLLGHYGVHPGAAVTVVFGPKSQTVESDSGQIDAADSIFALLGATLLGGRVHLTPQEPVESRALVVPIIDVDRYETRPGCTRVVYGGVPEDPAVVHFEQEMWSENPIEPPEPVEPDDPAIVIGENVLTHAELLSAATDFVESYELTAGDRVVLDAPLDESGSILAVLGTIAVGATLVIPEADSATDSDYAGKVVVTTADRSADRFVTVETLSERLHDIRRA